jgi:hypothetical protein
MSGFLFPWRSKIAVPDAAGREREDGQAEEDQAFHRVNHAR